MFEFVAASVKPLVLRGLAASDVFQDPHALDGFFSSRDSLSLWQHVLPDWGSAQSRAEKVYRLLKPRYHHPNGSQWYSGRNALQILLSELYWFYQVSHNQPAPHDLNSVFQIMKDAGVILRN
ncbi:MAG: hypothetical protein ACOCXQ_02750 [Patescibacteria group bacterium]